MMDIINSENKIGVMRFPGKKCVIANRKKRKKKENEVVLAVNYYFLAKRKTVVFSRICRKELLIEMLSVEI